jgi:hypothetical protein
MLMRFSAIVVEASTYPAACVGQFSGSMAKHQAHPLHLLLLLLLHKPPAAAVVLTLPACCLTPYLLLLAACP